MSKEIDAVQQRNMLRSSHRATMDTIRAEESELRAKIDAAEQRIRDLTASYLHSEDELGKLGDDEDPTEIREQITTAESTNDAIRTQHDRAWKAKELAEAKDRVANLERIMTEAEEDKAAAFAEAEWPVPGLSIVDGEVHLDGTPFAETSAGRKLRTSTAIAIRLNPELKAIVIRDGSLLDDDNRTMIDEIAREHGFTVLMELVNGSAETGVVFSDGTIVDRKGGVS